MTIWIGSKGLVSELELMSLGILRSEEIRGDKADFEFLIGSLVERAVIDPVWPAINWPSWFTSFPSLTFLPNFTPGQRFSSTLGSLIPLFIHQVQNLLLIKSICMSNRSFSSMSAAEYLIDWFNVPSILSKLFQDM